MIFEQPETTYLIIKHDPDVKITFHQKLKATLTTFKISGQGMFHLPVHVMADGIGNDLHGITVNGVFRITLEKPDGDDLWFDCVEDTWVVRHDTGMFRYERYDLLKPKLKELGFLTDYVESILFKHHYRSDMEYVLANAKFHKLDNSNLSFCSIPSAMDSFQSRSSNHSFSYVKIGDVSPVLVHISKAAMEMRVLEPTAPGVAGLDSIYKLHERFDFGDVSDEVTMLLNELDSRSNDMFQSIYNIK